MGNFIDITGNRYGRWKVESYAGKSAWNCVCNCGTSKVVNGYSLRKGMTNGCIKCHPALGLRRTHGKSNTRLYNIWCNMKARCENPDNDAYSRYGGRGIYVCEQWRCDFVKFSKWALANGYSSSLTIDRIDNDDGYRPGNCRWATYAEQNRNYSRNRPVIFRGESILICDLATRVGLPQDILKNRIHRYGWPIEKAVSTPVQQRGGKR